jgi:hypothetical protein
VRPRRSITGHSDATERTRDEPGSAFTAPRHTILGSYETSSEEAGYTQLQNQQTSASAPCSEGDNKNKTINKGDKI